MRWLKSLFISGFLTYAWVASVWAVWQWTRGGDVLMWSGVLLANAPFALMISVWMLFQPLARTRAELTWLRALSLVGGGLCAYGSLGNAAAAPAAIGWALGGVLGVFAYVRWYSRFGRQASAALAVGRELPEIELLRADGQAVRTADLRGQPTVMLFFRGNWCPLCMAQIREIADQYRAMEAAGVRVALISPQPHRNTEALARKFQVPFDFLTDSGNQAAQALGIAAPAGLPAGMQALGYDSDTVMPTVIITDREGRVVWTDETDNYRVRPEPETFLQVLREHDLIDAAV